MPTPDISFEDLHKIYQDHSGIFHRIIKKYFPSQRVLRGREYEDIHTEILMKCFSNLHKVDTSKYPETRTKHPIVPWLLRIATNYCIDLTRKREQRIDVMYLSAIARMFNQDEVENIDAAIDYLKIQKNKNTSDHCENLYDEMLLQQEIDEAFDLLTADQRMCFDLYLTGHKIKDIAEIMDHNENFIKSLMHKGRCVMHQYLTRIKKRDLKPMSETSHYYKSINIYKRLADR